MCMFCGGILETALIVSGLSIIVRWFKNRHKKDECNCKNHDLPILKSRPLTSEERQSINEFVWSHFPKEKNNE